MPYSNSSMHTIFLTIEECYQQIGPRWSARRVYIVSCRKRLSLDGLKAAAQDAARASLQARLRSIGLSTARRLVAFR
jgi:hypothetical protein